VGIGFSETVTGSYTGNFQVLSCNASAVTVTDSGLPIIAGDYYEEKLIALPNASSVAWTINDLTAKTTASGTITLTLPRNTIFLNFQMGAISPTIGGDAYLSVVRYVLETGQ